MPEQGAIPRVAEPLRVETTVPDLAHPGTIFDLLNFRVSEFTNVSGSLVTRLCEGEFGLRREEWAVLAMIVAMGPLSPSELAAQSISDRSQTSKTLRTLAAKKLIVRELVEEDRRRAVIRVSEAGRALYRRIFPRVTEIHREVLSGFSRKELEVLAQCLRKMQIRALDVQRAGLVVAHADRRAGGSRKVWPVRD